MVTRFWQLRSILPLVLFMISIPQSWTRMSEGNGENIVGGQEGGCDEREQKKGTKQV